jgi:hypothetical protein
MIRTSVATFCADPWDVEVCVHQLLVEFGKTGTTVRNSVGTRKVKQKGLSLGINEIGDDSDFLTSTSLDPGSHVKLKHPGSISGNTGDQHKRPRTWLIANTSTLRDS